MVALLLLGTLLSVSGTGCSRAAPASLTVSQLLAESGGAQSGAVRVYGVFADTPVSSAAGTIFTLAESRGG